MWVFYGIRVVIRVVLPAVASLSATVYLWSKPLPPVPQRRPEYVVIAQQYDQLNARLSEVQRKLMRPMPEVLPDYRQLHAESLNLPPQVRQLKSQMVEMRDPAYDTQWNTYSREVSARLAATVVFLAIGAGLSWVLRGDGYEAYAQRVKAGKTRAFGCSARREVETFYAQNAIVLADTFPRSLFLSTLNATFHEGMEPTAAWAAAKKLIEQLHPLVTRGREIQRLEEERLRADKEQRAQQKKEVATEARQRKSEVAAIESQLAALGDRQDLDALDEKIALNRKLGQVQAKHVRQTITPEDL